LLQSDVIFKDLGLLIIDEEQRFGVTHKEYFKKMRTEIDVLTLTATPIPRTLGLAMEGLREFSVIATAPQKRLAIKTFVQPSSRGVIREAVLREFKRGGQVYFLHNEVDTIDNMKNDLEELLPEARIVVGHGQLPERELERVMRDFTQQRANRCCAPRSSRPASTSPPPTPSSSTVPTASDWRSCTSCAAVSAAATTRPTPICWCPTSKD
jgi:transcription-repair coupling factor (superfamily II helicase)